MILPRRRSSVERRIETLLEVLPANPGHGGLARLHRLGDLLIDPARSLGTLVGLQQDASVGELACGDGARGYEPLEVVSFSVAEDDWIFLLHNEASVPTMSFPNQIKRNGVLVRSSHNKNHSFEGYALSCVGSMVRMLLMK